MIDTMSPLDALFLHAEDGISHMHIGSCAIFRGPAPTIVEIEALIAGKLGSLPHYRQKPKMVVLQLGHPVWVDDPDFAIGNHLRHSALPPPGTQDELEDLMGRLMSHELDRSHPLWEAWVIEGLADDRWALVNKVHHCMVDGIAGTDMLGELLDTQPDAPQFEPVVWRPQPAPSSTRLALDALAEMALAPGRRMLRWTPTAISPTRAVRGLRDAVTGLRTLATELRRTVKPVSIEGLIGPRRRWASGQCSLADVKAIRAVTGGSVNDVVLAAISGAFRDILIGRGEPVDGVVLRSLVPVSVRRSEDHTANNQVAMLIAELPVDIADPVERLTSVRRQMAALKASHQATASADVIAAADLLAPALFAHGIHAVMRVLRRTGQGTVHTVTTNVAGPQQPLYALGREMLAYLPFVPVSEGVRIGVAIVSYNGTIGFGVTGDYETVPDVRRMAEQIVAEIQLLKSATRRRKTSATTAGKTS